MKRIISIITSIMVTLSFTLPAELVFAEENLAPETEHVVEQEAKATDDCADCRNESCTECATEEPTAYVPNEVIVVFESKTALKKAETTAENAVAETEGSEVAENIEVGTISNTDKAVLVQSDENIDELALCEELEDQKGVAYAQPNFLYTIDEGENADLNSTTSNTSNWQIDYIFAQEAWDFIDKYRAENGWTPNTNNKVIVAALDMGAKLGHRDFTDPNTKEGINVNKNLSKTVVSKNAAPYYTVRSDIAPKGGHGTRTAGAIAAANNGVDALGAAAGNNNDLVELIAVNVFGNTTSTSQSAASSADIVAGIHYAVDNGARVIQMCLGRSTDDQYFKEGIEWAVNEKNVVVTASAGNACNDSPWYPSDYEACISVINTIKYEKATDICRNLSKSNYGSQKDISAPGTEYPLVADAATGTYDTGVGTSYAAPLVASVSAMVRYVNPNLTVNQVKDVLYSTATDLYVPGFDVQTGYGNVNAYKAVYKAAYMTLEHPFDQEEPNAEYLKSAANCTNAAVYYKSNDIGESSQGTVWESTFTYGEKTGHVWNTDYSIDNQAGCVSSGNKSIHCKYCSATKPGSQVSIPAHGHYIVKTQKVNPTCCSVGYKAHYECAYCHTCYKDKKGKKTASLTKYKIKKKSHSYTKKIATPKYLKRAATTKSAAIYYKSCKWCGKKGKSTFKYGKKLPK